MLDINIEHFRTFYYVVKHASFSKAAEALYLSQPAISRSIQILEKWSGCLLFIRTSKGVELTDEGQHLYQHVESAMNELFLGEALLSRNLDELTGHLEIGATETPFYHFLLPILIEFQKLHPKVKVGFSGNINTDLLSDLKKGAIDMAFIVSPIPDHSSFKVTQVKEIQDIFIAGPAFSELDGKTLSAGSISQYPIACYADRTSFGQFIRAWFQLQGVTLNPQYTVRASTLVLPFVLNGLSIGILPYEFAEPHIHSGAVFRIKMEQELPPRKLFMVTNNDLPTHMISREFERFVQLKLLELFRR